MKFKIVFFVLTFLFFGGNNFAKTILVIEKDSLIVKSNSKVIGKILDSKVKKLAKTGYPFAKIILEEYKRKAGDDIFRYRIQQGEKVVIDTIVYGKFKKREVNVIERNISELPIGKFNYLKVNQAINDLRSVDYLTIENRKSIYKTGLRLYVKSKDKMKIDALLSYKKGKTESGIVGNFSIEMQNLFGIGRHASLSWRRPNLKTNRIKLKYYEPYIFNTGFSLMGEYYQDFYDTLYVKRDINLHVFYQISHRLKVGYVNSLENIYPSKGGEDAGIDEKKKYGTSVLVDGYFGRGIFVNKIFCELGMKSSKNEELYFSTISSNLKIRYKKFGSNIKAKYGIVDSENNIQIYDKLKLGGGEFLRGAYFEQYLTEEYYGFSFEIGIFSGESNIFTFYDLGILRELNSPTHHLGFSMKLPAGKSHISLTIGFNVAESYENGKVHIRWNL